MSIFFFFWSQSVCYFFVISEVMEWFMVLLELKATETIHNCEQSLLLLEGTRQGICASQKHIGGEFQFGNGMAMFSPLELNLHRWVSRETVASFSLEQWSGHQNASCFFSPMQGIHGVTPHTPQLPIKCLSPLHKGRIHGGRTTSVLLTPICRSIYGT